MAAKMQKGQMPRKSKKPPMPMPGLGMKPMAKAVVPPARVATMKVKKF